MTILKLKLTLSIFFSLTFIYSVFATKYGMPKSREIKSNNKEFTLKINPKTKTHSIHKGDEEKSLWTFKKDVWHFPFFLSNDGKVVAVPVWRHVKKYEGDDLKEKVCIEFYNEKGIFKVYKFEDIIPNPPKTQDVGKGPIGDFWRTWYKSATSENDTVILDLTNGKKVTFSLKDGSIVKE